MPLGIQRLNAKRSQPNERIVFIKPLEGPDKAVARDFLERIAAQCSPIMRDHHLSVMSLEEYEPNREFVGRNFNAGEVIQLVLKSQSGRWLPFEYVQMVMMHELAHCKQMNHSRFFWAVRNQYAEQMRLLWGRGYTGEGIWGRGVMLSTGAFQKNTILPGETLPAHLCGGTYRSRGRKRKARPKLSYQEQKERRILKKFGRNGVVLGADEEVKAEPEKGKKTKAKGKPRVARSARGRELRAAAALARFDQQKSSESVKPEDEDPEFKTEEAASEGSDYEDDPADLKTEDALDLDGRRLVDSHGRGMIKVCEDEDPDDQDAQRELRELQSTGDWKQTRLEYKPVAGHQDGIASSSRGQLPDKEQQRSGPERLSETHTPRIKKEDEDEDEDGHGHGHRDLDRDKVEGKFVATGEFTPTTVKVEEESETPRRPTTLDEEDPPRATACGACSFLNLAQSILCSVCSNVLDPESVPGAWRCQRSGCRGSQYLNPGDYGVCGICGQGRS
ncbi:WLM-domain-containing protein [Sodiomyces alkalinus F11]|uniref:WLM-domain-containing protein n=1 Tax=Sodiomyces alkalinus (strain CBS 110278 / VKM F-3762 / F11) TaxID=1314773 RepID=A0A3N2PZ23_SODAK|nr:WLM-domain-containing protein [Sodiomyces alkalinus F11]ROT39770.1 WLM-domain-containing protein [Sodiomyces alkalinus F11]